MADSAVAPSIDNLFCPEKLAQEDPKGKLYAQKRRIWQRNSKPNSAFVVRGANGSLTESNGVLAQHHGCKRDSPGAIRSVVRKASPAPPVHKNRIIVLTRRSFPRHQTALFIIQHAMTVGILPNILIVPKHLKFCCLLIATAGHLEHSIRQNFRTFRKNKGLIR